MNIFDEFSEIIKHIEKENIRYAIVGGVAMAFYAEPRFTQDIDMLLEPNDFEKARRVLSANGYFESAEPWTFKSTPLTLHRFFKAIENDQMIIDLLVAGDKKHLEIIENALIAEGQLGTANIACKADIIWLKRQRNSLQDQADIERLENEEG
jgi:hypothetical protein